MTDDTGYLRGRPRKTGTGAEGLRTIELPSDDLVIDESAIDEEMVHQLTKSIASGILINPPTVIARRREDGSTEYRVIAGLQRAVAEKRIGKAIVRCTLLECEDLLVLEQVSIDENLIRRHLSAAESAMLWGRRSEIEKKRGEHEGTLSQNATASKQAMRASGLETGHDVGSARDQAEQTGESLAKISRAMRRYGDLGPAVLKSIVGTSLDTGVELDALVELPGEVRGDLVKRAVAGEEVSAKKALSKPKRKSKHQSSVIDFDHAVTALYNWMEKYGDLLQAKGLWEQAMELYDACYNAADHPDETDAPEGTSEPEKKSGWFEWVRGRKGD